MTTKAHNYSEPTVLRADSFPMRLYEKAKRLGVWNPAEIDFSRDREDWEAMNDERRKAILRLTARFLAGEEAVTLDLLPLILAIARQGRLEEEIFLTTFLFEEAKHTDFFSRWVREVAGSPKLPSAPEPSIQLFDVELPSAMNALLEDDSPAAHRPRIGDLQHGDRGRAGRDRLSELPPVACGERPDARPVRRAGQHQAR